MIKFAYFFNAVFYCMHIQHYRMEQKKHVYSERFKAFLWETFTTKRPDMGYIESLKHNEEVKFRAMKMGRADYSVESNFRAVASFGSFFLLFLSFLIIYCLGKIDLPLPLVAYIFGAPMFMAYYVICAVVFQKDNYKKFFREFRKEDEAWVQKWLKITLYYELISLFGPVILGLGLTIYLSH